MIKLNEKELFLNIRNFIVNKLDGEIIDSDELNRGCHDFAKGILEEEAAIDKLGFFAYLPDEEECEYILRFKKELFEEFGLKILSTQEALSNIVDADERFASVEEATEYINNIAFVVRETMKKDLN